MAYFILSLDGGGIRGVLTAALLGEIERRIPFLDRVDLVAGTSTGGILALAIARGLAPPALVDLYARRGRKIFGSRDLVDTVACGADELCRADYGTEALARVLADELGPGTLGSLEKHVLVAAFDLESGRSGRWKPKFFHNFEGDGSDRDESIVDVALRSAAAPTYFPAYQGYVDGGVVANNPAACAVAQAVNAGVSLADVRLLSLGTGQNPHRLGGEHRDWGLLQWGPRILELVLEGSLDVPDYQCRQLLGVRYHRLEVKLPKPIKLDAVAAIPELLALVATTEVVEQVERAAEFVGAA